MSAVAVNPDLVEQAAALTKAATFEPVAPDAPAGTLPQLADQPRVLDLLTSLSAIPHVTADDLRTTKCGLVVAKLAKFHHPAVNVPAKALLAKWKALVGVTTPVELAKANQAAKAKELAAAKQVAATAAPVKSESKVHDSESSDEDTSSKKRKSEKGDKKKNSPSSEESQAKKQKTTASSPVLSASSSSGAIKKDAPLAHQYPELMKGPYGLFYTEDSTPRQDAISAVEGAR